MTDEVLSTMDDIHSEMVDWSQATECGPKRTCRGKVPSRIRVYMVFLPSPVTAITSLIRMKRSVAAEIMLASELPDPDKRGRLFTLPPWLRLLNAALLPIAEKFSDGLKPPADPLTLLEERRKPCCVALHGAPYRWFRTA